MQYLIKEQCFDTFHFTTPKSCGNMKNALVRKEFCKKQSINYNKIVFANQIHGTMIKTVIHYLQEREKKYIKLVNKDWE